MRKRIIFMISFLCTFLFSSRNEQAAMSIPAINAEVQVKQKIHIAPGILMENKLLRVRIVDNSERYNSIFDNFVEGLNGVAVLMHADQRKNIFSTVGMNLEGTHTSPAFGRQKDAWNAPRVAPMQMKQIDSMTVRLTQSAREAAGLNFEIDYHLDGNYIDQTITFWPDIDIEQSDAFFASYMNQVQNTSLYLRRPQKSERPGEWLEVVSAGHGGQGGVFSRPVDPVGKEWHEFLTDNPLLRQSRQQSPETRQATLDAGFSPYTEMAPDHFWVGFVDDYVLLMIFKEPAFGMWISASGSLTTRNPAWDYQFFSGPQKANERRTYHVRAVYKKYQGIHDVLDEVERFLKK
jgi:hypothetical protein